MNYPSLTHLKAMAKVRESNEYAAEKRTVKALLEKTFHRIGYINLIHQVGKVVAVDYVAYDKGRKHGTKHKARIEYQGDNMVLVEDGND